MHRIIRQTLIAAGLALLAAAPAAAQDYPTRPIRFLQGFAAGGNADLIARVLADELSKSLSQPVIVEARPGAGGNLAADQVAKSTPDGYTLLLVATSHVISPAIYKSLPFDPVSGFDFITTVTEQPHFIVANAKTSRFNTLAELVASAKANPGKLTFGSAGVGTGQHLNGELLNTITGAKMVHVPYRGDSAAVAGLLSGDVDFIVAPLAAVSSNIEAGMFRALATTGGKPWPQLPNVPPVASVVPEFGQSMPWTGIVTAHGTPKPIIDRLNADLTRIIASPTVANRLREFGGEGSPSSPQQMEGKVKSEIARWTKVIETAGIPKQ